MKAIWILTSFAVAAFAGCVGRDSLDEIVFFRSKDILITAAEVRDSVLLSRKISEFSGRNIADKNFVEWANSTAFRTIPGILANHLLMLEFNRLGIYATCESDRAVLAKHNRFMRKKAKSKEELALEFGCLKDKYLAQFEVESRRTVFLASISNKVAVTEADVTAQYEHNRQQRAKEESVYNAAVKKANAAWESLNVGVPWDEVAAKYSEDALLSENYKNFHKEWESIPKTGPYQPEDVAVAVRKLKDGEYTKPIETDDGLIIVRVNSSDDASLDCARIEVRLPYFTPTPKKEELRNQMNGEAVQEYLRELIHRLHEQQEFVYPMGTNITYRIFK